MLAFNIYTRSLFSCVFGVKKNSQISIFMAGSWTPLHADVFRSYSWSANVCGKKKWIFLPPSQCHLVFDRYA